MVGSLAATGTTLPYTCSSLTTEHPPCSSGRKVSSDTFLSLRRTYSAHSRWDLFISDNALPEEAHQDVLLGVLVAEEGLPAAVGRVVPPDQLDLVRSDLVVDLLDAHLPGKTTVL